MKRKFATKRLSAIALATMMATSNIQVFASDINGHWAESVMNEWSNEGLISGFPDGTMRPDETVTRAQFVMMIQNSMGLIGGGSDVDFTDVKSTDWFYDAVAVAVANGVASGFPDGSFAPNDTVTRAQSAVFGANALGITTGGSISGYNDSASIPSWASNAIGAMSDKGYLSGMPDGSFAPNAPLTRAQAVSFLDRVRKDNSGNSNTSTNTNTNTTHTVTASGSTYDNQTFEGNVSISSSVGDGEVYFNNVTIKGDLIVNGGGDDSIYLTDTKVEGRIIMNYKGVRVSMDGNSSASAVQFSEAGNITATDDFTGKVTAINIPSAISTVNKITIDVPADSLTIDGRCSIDLRESIGSITFGTNSASSVITTTSNVVINTLTANAKVDIQGKGDIGTLNANASGITYASAIDVDSVNTATGVTAPTCKTSSSSGGGSSSGGSSNNWWNSGSGGSSGTTTPSNPKPDTGDGDGGADTDPGLGDVTPTVSYNISLDNLNDTKFEMLSSGDIVDISATLGGEATTSNGSIVWTSSDESIAEVSGVTGTANAKVKMIADGETTITAKWVSNDDKTLTRSATYKITVVDTDEKAQLLREAIQATTNSNLESIVIDESDYGTAGADITSSVVASTDYDGELIILTNGISIAGLEINAPYATSVQVVSNYVAPVGGIATISSENKIKGDLVINAPSAKTIKTDMLVTEDVTIIGLTTVTAEGQELVKADIPVIELIGAVTGNATIEGGLITLSGASDVTITSAVGLTLTGDVDSLDIQDVIVVDEYKDENGDTVDNNGFDLSVDSSVTSIDEIKTAVDIVIDATGTNIAKLNVVGDDVITVNTGSTDTGVIINKIDTDTSIIVAGSGQVSAIDVLVPTDVAEDEDKTVVITIGGDVQNDNGDSVNSLLPNNFDTLNDIEKQLALETAISGFNNEIKINAVGGDDSDVQATVTITPDDEISSGEGEDLTVAVKLSAPIFDGAVDSSDVALTITNGAVTVGNDEVVTLTVTVPDGQTWYYGDVTVDGEGAYNSGGTAIIGTTDGTEEEITIKVATPTNVEESVTNKFIATLTDRTGTDSEISQFTVTFGTADTTDWDNLVEEIEEAIANADGTYTAESVADLVSAIKEVSVLNAYFDNTTFSTPLGQTAIDTASTALATVYADNPLIEVPEIEEQPESELDTAINNAKDAVNALELAEDVATTGFGVDLATSELASGSAPSDLDALKTALNTYIETLNQDSDITELKKIVADLEAVDSVTTVTVGSITIGFASGIDDGDSSIITATATGSISGTVNTPLGINQEIVISLMDSLVGNARFVDLTEGGDITSWFDNAIDGLKYELSLVGTATLTVKVTGTPTIASNSLGTVTIPKENVTTVAGDAVGYDIVVANPTATVNIADDTPSTFDEIKSVAFKNAAGTEFAAATDLQVGREITAEATTDATPLTRTEKVTYQWYVGAIAPTETDGTFDPTTDTTNWAVATGDGNDTATYTMADADYGKYLVVVATATDTTADTYCAVVSDTVKVAPVLVTGVSIIVTNLADVEQITTTTEAYETQVIEAVITTDGLEGVEPTGNVTYNWQHCDTEGGTYANINDADGSTPTDYTGTQYKINFEDSLIEDYYIKAVVTQDTDKDADVTADNVKTSDAIKAVAPSGATAVMFGEVVSGDRTAINTADVTLDITDGVTATGSGDGETLDFKIVLGEVPADLDLDVDYDTLASDYTVLHTSTTITTATGMAEVGEITLTGIDANELGKSGTIWVAIKHVSGTGGTTTYAMKPLVLDNAIPAVLTSGSVSAVKGDDDNPTDNVQTAVNVTVGEANIAGANFKAVAVKGGTDLEAATDLASKYISNLTDYADGVSAEETTTINPDGDVEDIVITDLEAGTDYTIYIVFEDGTLATETYTVSTEIAPANVDIDAVTGVANSGTNETAVLDEAIITVTGDVDADPVGTLTISLGDATGLGGYAYVIVDEKLDANTLEKFELVTTGEKAAVSTATKTGGAISINLIDIFDYTDSKTAAVDGVSDFVYIIEVDSAGNPLEDATPLELTLTYAAGVDEDIEAPEITVAVDKDGTASDNEPVNYTAESASKEITLTVAEADTFTAVATATDNKDTINTDDITVVYEKETVTTETDNDLNDLDAVKAYLKTADTTAGKTVVATYTVSDVATNKATPIVLTFKVEQLDTVIEADDVTATKATAERTSYSTATVAFELNHEVTSYKLTTDTALPTGDPDDATNYASVVEYGTQTENATATDGNLIVVDITELDSAASDELYLAVEYTDATAGTKTYAITKLADSEAAAVTVEAFILIATSTDETSSDGDGTIIIENHTSTDTTNGDYEISSDSGDNWTSTTSANFSVDATTGFDTITGLTAGTYGVRIGNDEDTEIEVVVVDEDNREATPIVLITDETVTIGDGIITITNGTSTDTATTYEISSDDGETWKTIEGANDSGNAFTWVNGDDTPTPPKITNVPVGNYLLRTAADGGDGTDASNAVEIMIIAYGEALTLTNAETTVEKESKTTAITTALPSTETTLQLGAGAVTYISLNEDIATVDGGVITGVAEGTTEIIVTWTETAPTSGNEPIIYYGRHTITVTDSQSSNSTTPEVKESIVVNGITYYDGDTAEFDVINVNDSKNLIVSDEDSDISVIYYKYDEYDESNNEIIEDYKEYLKVVNNKAKAVVKKYKDNEQLLTMNVIYTSIERDTEKPCILVDGVKCEGDNIDVVIENIEDWCCDIMAIDNVEGALDYVAIYSIDGVDSVIDFESAKEYLKNNSDATVKLTVVAREIIDPNQKTEITIYYTCCN